MASKMIIMIQNLSFQIQKVIIQECTWLDSPRDGHRSASLVHYDTWCRNICFRAGPISMHNPNLLTCRIHSKARRYECWYAECLQRACSTAEVCCSVTTPPHNSGESWYSHIYWRGITNNYSWTLHGKSTNPEKISTCPEFMPGRCEKVRYLLFQIFGGKI